MASKYVPLAQSPSKMMPFKKQTSRERGIFHKPLEELPKMQPGHSTASGYWPTPNPPTGWEQASSEFVARNPAIGTRVAKHITKNEQIAQLSAEIALLRSQSRAGGAGAAEAGAGGSASAGGSARPGFLAPQRSDVAQTRPETSSSAASSYRPPSRDLGSFGMRQWERDVFATAARTGYPRVGRPRTPTMSHEVLWSEMPNSLYRSHAVERVASAERARIGTGRRAARRQSRDERATAVPISIPYM